MKVLLISNFLDQTGWSYAAQAYALAMDSVGIDLVLRNIKLNNAQPDIPIRIRELLQKNDKNCDVVIQKVLPHMMSYNGNFKKNIGLFVTETSHFRNCVWASHLNVMNEIIVPSTGCADACTNSGITKPVHVIPEPYDEEQFSIGYEPLELELPEENFKFYFIGENTKRKNLQALVEAFHLAFAPHEPVELVIKTSVPGLDIDKEEQAIREFLAKIKYGLKLYNNADKYKRETVVLGRLPDLDLMRLHAACHCYVAPSFGEAWNRPCFDALAFGNPVIATKGCGMDEYLPLEFAVSSTKVPCVGAIDTFGELCVANESWNQISIYDMMTKMRDVYDNYKKYKNIAINTNLSRFTYESVGNQIKDILTQ